MTAFLVIGGVGVLVVVASLVFDFAEGLFGALDIDTGSGLFSVPVIGSFLAAFGFGGAITMSAAGDDLAAGLVGAFAGGVAMGAGAFAITRALMRMPTDDNVRLGDLVGKTAVVVTRIPEAGLGEISLVHLGQRMKLHARAEQPVPNGANVVITAITSASSVLVEPEESFWGPAAELGGS